MIWMAPSRSAVAIEGGRLGRACLNGHLPVVQWLLREGGSSIEEKCFIGGTPLLCASNKGHLPVVQWLEEGRLEH